MTGKHGGTRHTVQSPCLWNELRLTKSDKAPIENYCVVKAAEEEVIQATTDLERKEKTRKDYTFRRVCDEKPGDVPGCPN